MYVCWAERLRSSTGFSKWKTFYTKGNPVCCHINSCSLVENCFKLLWNAKGSELFQKCYTSLLVYLAPTRALEPHEVRQEIYKRECRRLNVIPLSSYLRNPIRNSLAVPYCGLGPRGAMALAAPLMVFFIKSYVVNI